MPPRLHPLVCATASGVASLEPHPAAVVDARHRVVAANARFREEVGAGAEVVGRRCHELGHERARPCPVGTSDCPLAMVRATGAPARAVHIHATPLGAAPTLVRARRAGGPPREGWSLLVMEPLPEASARPDPGRLVGRSLAFRRMLAQLSRAAPTVTPLLLHGPAGAGKRRVARAVHAMSPRSAGPFVAVDCRELCDLDGAAALFGTRAGQASGRAAPVPRAERGSLYLAGVEALPRSLQTALLRLGESGLYLPDGAGRPLRADVRLLAGSRRNPAALVRAGSLAPELAALLAVFPVEIPSLDRRREDIPLLAEALLQELRGSGPAKRLDAGAAATLRKLSYPENVRGLAELLGRSWRASEGDRLVLRSLPSDRAR